MNSIKLAMNIILKCHKGKLSLWHSKGNITDLKLRTEGKKLGHYNFYGVVFNLNMMILTIKYINFNQ